MEKKCEFTHVIEVNELEIVGKSIAIITIMISVADALNSHNVFDQVNQFQPSQLFSLNESFKLL